MDADGDGGTAHPARSIDHPRVRREVARVQRIVEGEHGDVRSRLLSYAQLLELQRQAVQGWRQAVLEGRGGENLDAASTGGHRHPIGSALTTRQS